MPSTSSVAARGVDQGPFLKFKNGNPLTKATFTQHVRAALQAIGLPEPQFAGHSFRIGRFYYLNAWQMEQHSFPAVYPHSQTAACNLLKVHSSLSPEIETL